MSSEEMSSSPKTSITTDQSKPVPDLDEPLQHFAANRRWFDKNLTRLLKEYKNKFVAVWGKKVIAAEEDLMELVEAVNRKWPQRPDGLFVELVTDEPLEMVL